MSRSTDLAIWHGSAGNGEVREIARDIERVCSPPRVLLVNLSRLFREQLLF